MQKSTLILGVGINDSDYQIKNCPYYSIWNGMIKRCYSSPFHRNRPTYKGCVVSLEWIKFTNFKAWMESQDWQGKHLDKDIMYPGNRIYSKETCVFVSPSINNLLIDHSARRGKYPQGVSFANGQFNARISIDGKLKHIERCSTAEKSSLSYRAAKRLRILTIACCENDVRVKQGLYRHSELLRPA